MRIPLLLLLALPSVVGAPGVTGQSGPPGSLVDAAKRGDDHAVRRLLTGSPDLDARGPMGYTALHWAAIREHRRIAAELVAAGSPVDAVGSDGGTPLHWACHHDQPSVIWLLLEAGADPNLRNRWGRAPLHVAARRNNLQDAELLLEAGADPNATTHEGWTPFHVASRSGHAAMVELLAARGSDPTRTDADGLTPEESWRPRPSPVAVDVTRLDAYIGIYDLGHGATAKVWRDGEALRIREFAADDLYPIGVDEFSCRKEPWQVRFVRGDDGDVERIEIDFLRRTVRGTKTVTPLYIGSAACMDCHGGEEEGSQDVLWLRSRHAHAYWRLGADWALFAASFRPQEGVNCEACHGPGSEYASVEVMSDREAFLARGGRIPDEATCRGCHRNPESFDWADKWTKIAHPRPDTPAGGSADGPLDSPRSGYSEVNVHAVDIIRIQGPADLREPPTGDALQ